MSRDKHKNIFYFYRAPSKHSKTDKLVQKDDLQIENNLTKALINVLDPGNLSELIKSKNPLRDDFFTWIAKKLQAEGKALTNIGTLRRIKMQDHLDSSIPDAIFEFEADSAIGLETKYLARIDENQLRRHLDNLRKDYEDVRILLIAPRLSLSSHQIFKEKEFYFLPWESIFDFFEKRIKNYSERDEFLISQYLEYMGLMHMVNRFLKQDFDDFESNGDSRHVREKLSNFATLLHNQITDNEKYSKLKTWHVNEGKKTKDCIWLTISPSRTNEDTSKDLHFTFEMSKNSISAYLNSEGRTCPKKVGELLNKNYSLFFKEIKKMEKIKGDKITYSIIYNKGKYFGRGNKEIISNTRIEILKPKNSSKSQSHHFAVMRKKEIERIITELCNIKKTNKIWYWFRIQCQISMEALICEDTLEKQVNVVKNDVERLYSLYNLVKGLERK